VAWAAAALLFAGVVAAVVLGVGGVDRSRPSRTVVGAGTTTPFPSPSTVAAGRVARASRPSSGHEPAGQRPRTVGDTTADPLTSSGAGTLYPSSSGAGGPTGDARSGQAAVVGGAVAAAGSNFPAGGGATATTGPGGGSGEQDGSTTTTTTAACRRPLDTRCLLEEVVRTVNGVTNTVQTTLSGVTQTLTSTVATALSPKPLVPTIPPSVATSVPAPPSSTTPTTAALPATTVPVSTSLPVSTTVPVVTTLPATTTIVIPTTIHIGP
jgi:hypothetical protein